MLTNNNLFKFDQDGNIIRINTDDIPEGDYNKYCLNYADGKQIGEIYCNSVSSEDQYQVLVNGQLVHYYTSSTFYEWASSCKKLAETDSTYEYFNKTEDEYTEFYEANVFEDTDENYCPYYVIGSTELIVYEVSNNDTIGYTNIQGEADTEVTEGYIYQDTLLSTVLSTDYTDWYYTGNTEESTDNWVKLPTYPTYLNGNKTYWHIVINSRVDDNTTSIRSVAVGTTETLDSSEGAYVKNSGTVQNLVLNFGIPQGIQGPQGERGEQGPAGGVVSLQYVSTTVDNATEGDKLYNTEDNIIYIYENGQWVEYAEPDEGVIYILDEAVYHYNGSSLVLFSTAIQADEETVNFNNGKLVSTGTLSKNNVIIYDWIGTEAEWEEGRASGEIQDNWICFVTDDNAIQISLSNE